MALKVVVQYRKAAVVFDVARQEDEVYCLRLSGDTDNGKEHIPQKIIIRKKGKIWVSDMENYPELLAKLTAEVKQLSGSNERTSDE